MNAFDSTLTVAHASAELWRYRLATPVGGSGVATVDLVVVELETGAGRRGLGFSYVLGASAETAVLAARLQLERFVVGKPFKHPEALSREIQQSFNRSGRGPNFVGMAAVDVAAWDLYARCLEVPVGIAMGGQDRAVPVYGSGGFRAGQAAESALEMVQQYRSRGMSAIKLRVSGSLEDLALIDAVARGLGGSTGLMLDANEKCTRTSAIRLLEVARQARALFVEEPLPAHDLAGYARLAQLGFAIATGEHLQGMAEWGPFLRGRLCDMIQPDLAMMGGLSECLRLARAAELQNIEVAPHFLPGLFVHLAAAMPNVTWLEDFPLLEPLFAEAPRYGVDGTLRMPGATGLGLEWASGAREEFLVNS